MPAATHLICEYRTDPLGIDVVAPRLGWRLTGDGAGTTAGLRQTAYQVLVATSADRLQPGQADLWDSGRVESDRSVHVVYGGDALTSRQRAHWRVIVWDGHGRAVESESAWWEMGLLERDDWQADWIGAPLTGGPRTGVPAPYVRKSFEVDPDGPAVVRARLYVTALGLYDCTINGRQVNDDVLAPGWTDYRQRIPYRVYDVIETVSTGENVVGAIIGDGWAAGHLGMAARQNYVIRPTFLAQLEITFADGSRQVVATDGSWRHTFGAVVANDLLHGESYDARLEMPGWDGPGFDASRWLPVDVSADHGAARVATNGPAIVRVDELQPLERPADQNNIMTSRVVLDFGQNLVGWVRLRGTGSPGATVTLRFAEVLDEHGRLYTANLRSARATDHYTFRGDPEGEEWEPRFTFHGFRYVEVSGFPGPLEADSVTAIVVHSDMRKTGDFTCSDPLINQLQRNISWGQKGNFVDVPTDCPQRDERLGWSGDIQVFTRTAGFNMDVAGFLTKWARDLADAQSPDGSVPPVIPKAVLGMPDGGPAWADAVVICPWTMHLCYGDTRILEENYEVMTRFMDWLVANSPGLIRCGADFPGWLGFGDWLSINADTPRDLIGTAFLAYDAALMAQIATALGRSDDATKYQELHESTKAAFGDRFLAGSSAASEANLSHTARRRLADTDAISRGNLAEVDYGPVSSTVFNTELFTPTQTSYVLALAFDLLPEPLQVSAVDELVADIARRDGHLSTGFVGAPYLPHALSTHGRLDAAYELLRQTTWPSWLYPVTQGATTIWERWDGWTEENGFQDPDMNSFNHYAYGSIGAWLYNTVAGIEIDPTEPGYKHALLQPRPGGELTDATGRIDTLYGELVSSWTIVGDVFDWRVVVPPNTRATATMPPHTSEKVELDGETTTGSVHELGPGDHRLVTTFER